MKYSLRRLVTFSIRDVALVTLVVGLTLGWWIDHWQQADRRAKAEAGLLSLCDYLVEDGYKIGWDTRKNMLSVSRPTDLPKSSAPAKDSTNR